MQLFLNEKEVPTLVRALQILGAQDPESETAQKLLARIELCLDKQGKGKTKGAS